MSLFKTSSKTPLGRLEVTTGVDRKPRIYSGSQDPVTGNVGLQFMARHTDHGPVVDELFGPLKIKVIFQGVMETFADRSSGTATEQSAKKHYTSHKILFHQETMLYDGPFRVCARERRQFPFTTFFPERTRFTNTHRRKAFYDEGHYHEAAYTESKELDVVLPPSFNCRLKDGHVVYSAVRAVVSYSIRAEVEVPGIDVVVFAIGRDPDLQYRPTANRILNLSGSHMFEHSMVVSVEAQRPQNIREKAKALFQETTSRYAFGLICTAIPEHLFPGRGINFQVAIRTDSGRTTAAVTPDTTLEGCKIIVIACTEILALEHTPDNPHRMRTISNVVECIGGTSPEGLFSKNSDCTKRITTGPLPYLPNDFDLGRVSRSYELRIEMNLRVGKQKVGLHRVHPVQIHPSISAGPMEDLSATGPLQASMGEEEQLPAYEEACVPGPSRLERDNRIAEGEFDNLDKQN